MSSPRHLHLHAALLFSISQLKQEKRSPLPRPESISSILPQTIKMSENLCFLDAAALWRDSGPTKINDDEYLRIMLDHFKGIRHPYDKIGGNTLALIDTFAT